MNVNLELGYLVSVLRELSSRASEGLPNDVDKTAIMMLMADIADDIEYQARAVIENCSTLREALEIEHKSAMMIQSSLAKCQAENRLLKSQLGMLSPRTPDELVDIDHMTTTLDFPF